MTFAFPSSEVLEDITNLFHTIMSNIQSTAQNSASPNNPSAETKRGNSQLKLYNAIVTRVPYKVRPSHFSDESVVEYVVETENLKRIRGEPVFSPHRIYAYDSQGEEMLRMNLVVGTRVFCDIDFETTSGERMIMKHYSIQVLTE